jgi:hypothetical protein
MLMNLKDINILINQDGLITNHVVLMIHTDFFKICGYILKRFFFICIMHNKYIIYLCNNFNKIKNIYKYHYNQ